MVVHVSPLPLTLPLPFPLAICTRITIISHHSVIPVVMGPVVMAPVLAHHHQQAPLVLGHHHQQALRIIALRIIAHVCALMALMEDFVKIQMSPVRRQRR